MYLKFIFIFVLLALGTACSSVGNVKSFSDSPQGVDPNHAKSYALNELSNNFRKDIKRRGMLYSNKEANQYINAVGQKVAPEFMKVNNRLNFYITKDSAANAMALPNGDIYINIGLLSVIENEDQLAVILAHEVGHVVHRHSLKSVLNHENTKLAANIADIFLLGTGIGNIPAASSLASFSREQEKEADILSLSYLYKAGYDLRQAPEVFNIFKALPESLTVKDSAYSSHPANMERSRYLKKIINDTYPALKSKLTASEKFDKIRVEVVETNVKIRLRHHQYELALLTLEQAEIYYKKAALIQYYRGEVYRLKADNPGKAADEVEWLAAGSVEEAEERRDLEYFIKNKLVNYDKARSYYSEALEMKEDLALAHKGLGLVDYSNDKYEKAKMHLNTYLEMSGSPSDDMYIKRLIRNCGRKEDNS